MCGTDPFSGRPCKVRGYRASIRGLQARSKRFPPGAFLLRPSYPEDGLRTVLTSVPVSGFDGIVATCSGRAIPSASLWVANETRALPASVRPSEGAESKGSGAEKRDAFFFRLGYAFVMEGAMSDIALRAGSGTFYTPASVRYALHARWDGIKVGKSL